MFFVIYVLAVDRLMGVFARAAAVHLRAPARVRARRLFVRGVKMRPALTELLLARWTDTTGRGVTPYRILRKKLSRKVS
jgi:hypothetical protein